MKPQLRSLIPVFLAGFFVYGYNNVFMTITPLYCQSLGVDLSVAGLQGTYYLLLAVALRFYFGPLADVRGRRFVMCVGLVGFVAGGAVFLLACDFALVLLARTLQAVGLAAFFPCATAIVAGSAPAGKSGTLLGAYRFVTAAALLVWPSVVFAVAESMGYGVAFALLTAFALLALGAVLLTPKGAEGQRMAPVPARLRWRGRDARATGQAANLQRAAGVDGGEGRAGLACVDGGEEGADLACASDASEEKGSALRTLTAALRATPRASAVGLGITFIAAMGYGLLFSFTASFAAEAQPGINAGFFFTVFGVGGMVINLLAGWLADKANPALLMLANLACCGLGIAVLAALPLNVIALYVSGVLAGFGYSGCITSVLAYLSREAQPAYLTSLLSLQQNCIDLGIAAGSGIFGFVIGACGAVPSFGVFGALLVVIAAVLAIAQR